METSTYRSIGGLANLLAHQLVLPFLGLVAAGASGNGVYERHAVIFVVVVFVVVERMC